MVKLNHPTLDRPKVKRNNPSSNTGTMNQTKSSVVKTVRFAEDSGIRFPKTSDSDTEVNAENHAIIKRELTSFFNTQPEDKEHPNLIKLASYRKNQIILEINDKGQHMIQLTHPLQYPRIKLGFMCSELESDLAELPYIAKVNRRIKDKKLSILTILTFLVKTARTEFGKVEDRKSQKDSSILSKDSGILPKDSSILPKDSNTPSKSGTVCIETDNLRDIDVWGAEGYPNEIGDQVLHEFNKQIPVQSDNSERLPENDDIIAKQQISLDFISDMINQCQENLMKSKLEIIPNPRQDSDNDKITIISEYGKSDDVIKSSDNSSEKEEDSDSQSSSSDVDIEKYDDKGSASEYEDLPDDRVDTEEVYDLVTKRVINAPSVKMQNSQPQSLPYRPLPSNEKYTLPSNEKYTPLPRAKVSVAIPLMNDSDSEYETDSDTLDQVFENTQIATPIKLIDDSVMNEPVVTLTKTMISESVVTLTNSVVNEPSSEKPEMNEPILLTKSVINEPSPEKPKLTTVKSQDKSIPEKLKITPVKTQDEPVPEKPKIAPVKTQDKPVVNQSVKSPVKSPVKPTVKTSSKTYNEFISDALNDALDKSPTKFYPPVAAPVKTIASVPIAAPLKSSPKKIPEVGLGKSSKGKFHYSPTLPILNYSPTIVAPIPSKAKSKSTPMSPTSSTPSPTPSPTVKMAVPASRRTFPKVAAAPAKAIEPPEEIPLDDVSDPMGWFLNLTDYAKLRSPFPYNEQQLLKCAKFLQPHMTFGNVTKVKAYLPEGTVANVILNELTQCYKLGLKMNYHIGPVSDNIFHLRLALNHKFFDEEFAGHMKQCSEDCHIVVDIMFDSKLYPFSAPKIRYIGPRLIEGSHPMVMYALNEFNDPVYSLHQIISVHIKEKITQYVQLAGMMECYDTLENDMIELATASGFVNNFKPKTNTSAENQSVPRKVQTVWSTGTGYGHSGNTQRWNVAQTILDKNEHDRIIAQILRAITRRTAEILVRNISINVQKIYSDSCFLGYLKGFFKGVTLLDITLNLDILDTVLTAMSILPMNITESFMESEESLLVVMQSLITEIRQYLHMQKDQNTNDNREINILRNLKELFDRLSKNPTESIVEEVMDMEALNQLYVSEMKDEICQELADMDFSKFDSMLNRKRIDRKMTFLDKSAPSKIQKEIITYKNSLPLSFESSIFARFNEDLRYQEFMITGAHDTPYESGCFNFILYCTMDYPNRNPLVNIVTTGKGAIRFNPNLYADGTVCLTILGTWDGHESEKWIPSKSTLYQVIVSIQGLVMVKNPYYNEPGYEKQVDERSKTRAMEYNRGIQLNTMKWAMIDVIENPPRGFENIVKKHFNLKKYSIRKTCHRWLTEVLRDCQDQNIRKEFNATYQKLCRLLAMLE